MQSTRRGSFSVHRSEKTPGSKYSSTSGLSPRGHLERQAEFHHTNVFEFDTRHLVWKTSYVKEKATRSFCRMINVYNFLPDSFKYNRANDLGYLVARIF